MYEGSNGVCCIFALARYRVPKYLFYKQREDILADNFKGLFGGGGVQAWFEGWVRIEFMLE